MPMHARMQNPGDGRKRSSVAKRREFDREAFSFGFQQECSKEQIQRGTEHPEEEMSTLTSYIT